MLAYDFYALGQVPAMTLAVPQQAKVLTPEQRMKLESLRKPLGPLSDRQVLHFYSEYKRVNRELGSRSQGASPADYVAATTPLFGKAGIPVLPQADWEWFFDGAILEELWNRELLVRNTKTEFTPMGQMVLWTTPPRVFYVGGGLAAAVGGLLWFWKYRR